MEAVPRLPMIWFHLKVSPEPATFGPKLKQYIQDFYNEDPDSYTNEIHQLETLRATAVRPPIDMAGCLLVKKYYCQLHFLQSRFPMGKDGAAAITFTWRDTYANMVCSLANIRFEMISILYNIGSMHTQLGARTERTTADGMKMACAHFQCAAWAFEHLKNSYPQPSGVDLAPELMTFMHQLCLAQAQECILEKSMLDNRKPTIVAKVARQIVDYFALALNTLEQGGNEDGTVSDTVGTKIYKSWKRYVKFKRAYHLAVTHLYQGLAAEEQRKMGERVAFYNTALTSLSEAHTIFANAKGSMGITGASEEKTIVEEALTFTNDVIEGKRKAAKNENEFIYHEEVPEKEVLPTVKGASLVKGISFSINDSEVSGPDIFARLVPMKVHEASSLYSEEKAKILRSVGARVEEKDEQLLTYLASLKLDNLSLWDIDMQTSEWECLPLPDELVERCAALNAKPNVIQDLLDIMGKLSNISQDVERILKDIKRLLIEEELKEKQYQDAVGKRPPTIVATDLTREAKKYEEAHNKALESNDALHKAITMHVKNLKILAQPLSELLAYIPSPSTYIADQNNEKVQNIKETDKSHVKELKRILNKIDEMRRQRNDFQAKLRDSIAQDDLTRLLVTAISESEPLDRLFADQLNKHQALVNLIEQNLTAQDNILAALTDAYAQTADVRKGIDDMLKRREYTISSLIASYDAYEDLLAKSSKGLEFYRKLEINVSKLLQRVKSTCKVQEEERVQILAQDTKSMEEMIDGSVLHTYDQGNIRTGSTLKLKDYLNSRAEASSTHQSHYYGLYKSPAESIPINTPSVVKSLTNDTGIGNQVQRGSMPSVTEVTSSQLKPVQQLYHTSHVDSKANIVYPYGTQMYNQSLNVNTPLNKNYIQPRTTDQPTTYHHAEIPPIVTNTPVTMQYSTHSTELGFPVNSDGQDKFYPAHQSHYGNIQYNIYQPSLDYNRQHIPQEQAYDLTNPCNINQDKTNTMQSDNVDLPSQLQSMSLTIGTTTNTTTSIGAFNLHKNVVTMQNNNTPENQSASSIYNAVHTMSLPKESSTLMPNYSVSQTKLNEPAFCQPYPSSAYFTSPDQHVGNASINDTKNMTIASTQYLQTQCTNSATYSIHTATTAASEGAALNPSNSLNSHIVHHSQHGYVDLSKQSYPDNTFSVYSSSAQANVILNYSNSYQNFQHSTTGLPYQQTSTITSGPSISYPCVSSTNTEMIQSHTKTQSYQYPHQNHYPGYLQYRGYSQDYNPNYGYVEKNHAINTIPEQYKDHLGYTYDTGNQRSNYLYTPNSQSSLTPQIAKSYELMSQSEASASSINQQHESNARYTNASNNALVHQTLSSEYSNQVYHALPSTDTYYTAPYGMQLQGQGSVTKNDSQQNYNQTYMQAVNNGTNTTTSSNPVKLTTKSLEPKSNIDLLSDLDVTINHAPLVPEVRPLCPSQKEDNLPKDASNENKVKEDSIEKSNETIEDKAEMDSLQIVWDTWYTDVQPKKDPLGDPAALQKFINDVEKYEKFVDSLLVKTLSGATNLDIKWKEVQEFEERENGKQSSTVALAHSSENQSVDCIPYDTTRVQVLSVDSGSSYINASHVMEITQWIPTAFIVTQTPICTKLDVFWTMIWEQESEIIACLVSDAQLNGEPYWPVSEENKLNIGSFIITLKKTVSHSSYIQRILSVYHSKKKLERNVVHIQFLSWPSKGFPSSPGALLTFSTDVLSEQALRRCSPKPVIVHCTDGGSLSSLFFVAAATVCHIRAGCGIVDVPLVFKGLIKCRKQVVNIESLLFAYRMVLYHAQDILMKRGILSSTRSTFENFDGLRGNKDKASRKIHQCHPSDDFLHNFGTTLSRSETNQQEDTQVGLGNNTTTHANVQEKIDPLSQLDPLWSIRR